MSKTASSSAAIDEKALKKLKRIGRACGIDDDTFMERLMSALIANHKKTQSSSGA